MAIIDRALAIQHVKSDGETVEDPLIDLYLDSARSICEGYCNRLFYENTTALYAAFDDGLVALADAREWRTAQLAMEDRWEVIAAVNDSYTNRRGAALRAVNGCVADGSIRAAILMTFGHLYKNRQDNIVGNLAAVQLPVGAQRILQPYLWIGDLAGGS